MERQAALLAAGALRKVQPQRRRSTAIRVDGPQRTQRTAVRHLAGAPPLEAASADTLIEGNHEYRILPQAERRARLDGKHVHQIERPRAQTFRRRQPLVEHATHPEDGVVLGAPRGVREAGVGGLDALEALLGALVARVAVWVVLQTELLVRLLELLRRRVEPQPERGVCEQRSAQREREGGREGGREREREMVSTRCGASERAVRTHRNHTASPRPRSSRRPVVGVPRGCAATDNVCMYVCMYVCA